MRQLRSDANTADRLEYGIELAFGLRQFPETTPLAAGLEQQNQALESTYLARLQKQRALLPARVAVKLADYGWDRTVRAFSSAIEIADGVRRGALYDSVFPEGLSALVTPAGATQVKVAAAFVERLKASKVDGLDKPRAEWLPRLNEALTKLAAAVKARDAGVDAVGTARIAEDAAREDHELSVDKLVGEVRALYPKDRKRWEIIFPTVIRGGSRNDDPEPEPAP